MEEKQTSYPEPDPCSITPAPAPEFPSETPCCCCDESGCTAAAAPASPPPEGCIPPPPPEGCVPPPPPDGCVPPPPPPDGCVPPPPPHPPKRRRRKRPRPLFVLLVVLFLVTVILSGLISFFGLGKKGSVEVFAALKTTPTPQAVSENTPQPTDSAAAISTEPGVITVDENSIQTGGETLSLEALERKVLSEHQEGMVWKLMDSHAIKGTYDAVKSMLSENGIPYEEIAGNG